MLKRVKGDLLRIAEAGDFDIIVHGCNCQHTMGSGIAKQIKKEYPEAFYVDGEMDELFGQIDKLGNFSRAFVETNRIGFYIVNAYTQFHYLPRGIDHFEYDSFSVILRKLEHYYPAAKYGFPFIGMGLAGGDSKRIMKMLEDFAEKVTSNGGSVTLVEFEG